MNMSVKRIGKHEGKLYNKNCDIPKTCICSNKGSGSTSEDILSSLGAWSGLKVLYGHILLNFSCAWIGTTHL
jgi:hypothetical protein